MRIQHTLRIMVLLGLIGTGLSAQAATVLVPSNSPTITGAIAAANSGDVVLIENSAVYTEQVVVNKPITLMAAPNQTPTIRYDTAALPYSFVVFGASAGAQIGSNGGGRITLDGVGDLDITTFLPTPIGAGEIICENLELINGHASMQFLFPAPTSSAAVLTFRNLSIDGAGVVNFMIRPDLLNGATFNIEDCVIVGAGRFVVLHGGSGVVPLSVGTVNIEGSVLSGLQNALTSEPSAQVITWNVTNSVLESTVDEIGTAALGTSGACWWIRAPNQIITITRSVLIESGIGSTFYFFPGTGTTVTMDHVDIISRNNICVRFDGAMNRNLSIRNSNIYSFDSAGFFGSFTASDVLNNDYNNVFGGYDGLELVKPTIKGPNDPATPEEPLYAAPTITGLNFEYTNPVLLVADEFGGSLGSFLNFGIVPPPPPPPTASVADWNLYE